MIARRAQVAYLLISERNLLAEFGLREPRLSPRLGEVAPELLCHPPLGTQQVVGPQSRSRRQDAAFGAEQQPAFDEFSHRPFDPVAV